MKNLKTKIGISLTALAFFATVGIVSKSVWAVKPNPLPLLSTGKDPGVIKVIETLKKTSFVNGYEASEKTITFNYKDESVLSKDRTEFLEVKVYKVNKKGDDGKRVIIKDYGLGVIIKDYGLDNLDGKDEIIHYRTVIRSLGYMEWAEDIPETIKFDELSSKTQQEIRERYNKIIKEAPEKLLQADGEYKKGIRQQEEQKNKKLEEHILNIIK